MSTNFPASKDNSTSLPVEAANVVLATNHVASHQNLTDAVIAIETKVGADSSAVTSSHDYKLSEVLTATPDKAVGKVATQTLTNKTLTAPVITSPTLTVGSDATGDMYYNAGSGVLARLPKGNNGDYIVYAAGVPATAGISNASYAGKGLVQFLTDAPTSGMTVASGVANVNFGTSANQIVKLDGSAKLPAVDGSQLTGLTQTGVFSKISTVTISQACSTATTTKIAEWTSLTGDTDDIYHIEFEINSPQNSASTSDLLGLRINNDSTANHYGFANMRLVSNSATAANYVSAGTATDYRIAAGSTNIIFYHLSGEVRIKGSKTIAGTGRQITSSAVVSRDSDASQTSNERGAGSWSDQTNQITSLQLYFQQNSGSSSTVVGSATLYKINK